MKKLLKSKIYWSVNNIQDLYVAENWLKSQTFQLKKKRAETKRVSGKHKTRFPNAHLE